MKNNLLWLSFMILCIAGCNPKSEEKPTGVLTNAQEQTLQKAKQVDDTLKKAEEERANQLNQAEGN